MKILPSCCYPQEVEPRINNTPLSTRLGILKPYSQQSLESLAKDKEAYCKFTLVESELGCKILTITSINDGREVVKSYNLLTYKGNDVCEFFRSLDLEVAKKIKLSILLGKTSIKHTDCKAITFTVSKLNITDESLTIRNLHQENASEITVKFKQLESLFKSRQAEIEHNLIQKSEKAKALHLYIFDRIYKHLNSAELTYTSCKALPDAIKITHLAHKKVVYVIRYSKSTQKLVVVTPDNNKKQLFNIKEIADYLSLAKSAPLKPAHLQIIEL